MWGYSANYKIECVTSFTANNQMEKDVFKEILCKKRNKDLKTL